MKFTITLFICFLNILLLNAQQQNHRPKIGLTLSGGGAKGLAHIGILKAIDSAGLKIDYITGTSMGAVVGSLYAVGYSGKQIEEIAKKIDWDLMLSNQLSLRSLSMTEKEEYGKYAIELPLINNKLRLPSGFLEGQELWYKFAELYFGVLSIKNFNDFPIPFKCIGTDILTGQAVVMDKGDISSAVRASMAIPSVFTTVEYDGHRMVDGGMIRNFPVRDVKAMGADMVIGVSVSSGLAPKEKLNSAFDILMQLAFFREAEDYKKEIPLCDIFVPLPIEDYSVSSFSDADKLMEIGINEGKNLYPTLKNLVDSLNSIYGVQPIQHNKLSKKDSFFINSCDIRGLQKTPRDFFLNTMDFHQETFYTANALSKAIRRVYSTRSYSSISYSLASQQGDTAKIVFDVKENPSTHAKLGLHYNVFSGISFIANLTTRDFFTPYSKSLVTFNLGENFRFKGEHLQYFGHGKNFAIVPKFQFENFKINTYTGFVKSGQYRQNYTLGELNVQQSGFRSVTAGFGTRYERINFKPLILSPLDAKGYNRFLTTFGFIGINRLDRSVYPQRGVKFNAEFGLVYNQKPNIAFFSNGIPITNTDSLNINYGNYQRLMVHLENYTPVANRLTLFTLFQAGINLNYKQNLVNNFQVGGLVKTIRNQIVFAGLEETTLSTPSIAAFMLGLNYRIAKNTYIIAKTNALVNNFISKDRELKFDNWLTGHALTFAYNTPIGPLEFSLAYSDQAQRVLTYVNFGMAF